MSTNLQTSLKHYFEATNRHDVEAMASAFAEDAIVKDEGHEHHGTRAIRAWMEETIRKYDFKVEPTTAARTGDQTAVSVLVSGNFPGSPVTLTYWFRVHGQKIARLEIG